MPPRYSYWTIIAGGLPTAFRAADREELLPTFTRIKQKHPDAEMKWFARGRLWESPESARQQIEAQRRGRDWRPGGEHRDPRQRFKDAKRERNVEHRKRKFERRQRFAEGDNARGGLNRPRGADADRRPRPDRDRIGGPRMFQQKSFPRNQQRGERPSSPPPEEPRKEPRPREGTEPTPPPRPSEPVIPAPGPPERGRSYNKPRQQRAPFKRPGRRR
jgi:hypothetical protein